MKLRIHVNGDMDDDIQSENPSSAESEDDKETEARSEMGSEKSDEQGNFQQDIKTVLCEFQMAVNKMSQALDIFF
jgi:hypothetical protein